MQWTEYANIKFEVTSGDAEIRVTFDQGVAFSYVGTASRALSQEKATMNLRLDSNSAEESFARAVLHGFGHALGLKHVHQVTPSTIPWDLEALYYVYATDQNWSKEEVDLNVLNLLAADTGPVSSSDGDSVMLYSIPGSLTTNEVNIQGQGALTRADIDLVYESYPNSAKNDLNVSLVPTTHPVSPWQKVTVGGTYTLHQPISPEASAVPKAAIGLTDIYTGTSDEWIRITSRVATVTTSNIEVVVGTWSPSRLYQGTSSLFWATPTSPNPIFQTGKFSTRGQAINQRVRFEVPYQTRPKVFVGLSAIDLCGTFDLDTTVVSADKEGFYVNITSPGQLSAADIHWIAWPGNHPGVETGTFYTGPVAKNKVFRGEVELDTIFDSQPKVHFALSSFNVAKSGSFPIKLTAEVSKTSLTWTAETWLPQGLNRVRGNYLVFTA